MCKKFVLFLSFSVIVSTSIASLANSNINLSNNNTNTNSQKPDNGFKFEYLFNDYKIYPSASMDPSCLPIITCYRCCLDEITDKELCNGYAKLRNGKCKCN